MAAVEEEPAYSVTPGLSENGGTSPPPEDQPAGKESAASPAATQNGKVGLGSS